MNKSNKNKIKRKFPKNKAVSLKAKPVTSLLDQMEDGKEFESLVKCRAVNIDLISEIRNSIKEIESLRKRPLICYVSNIVNSSIKAPRSINYEDDLPFSEMVTAVPAGSNEVDILLVTPGGIAQQVAKFVDKLRPRFETVSFLLPDIAMSAGTIFVMSGDEIIMGPNAHIGPIDPQVPNKSGLYVPAQAILTLIKDIQKRGEEFIKNGQNPPWTDLLLLKEMDAKEIGSALTASQYSIELVRNYLLNYKFKTWEKHTSDGREVTDEDKELRAKEIAEYLCDHSTWKSHARGITRETAWNECRIKVKHSENVEGLDRALRRFWALVYWVFENSTMAKLFISSNYGIIRNDKSLISKMAKRG